MAAPVFATVADALSMGEGWEPQGSSPVKNQQEATATGSKGDIIANDGYAEETTGATRYVYTGAETGFAAAIVAALASPGRVKNSLLVLAVNIDYGPCAVGEAPVCEFRWSDKYTADPGFEYLIEDVTLPTYVDSAPEIPTILAATAGDAEATGATYTLEASKGNVLNKSGAFLRGHAYGAKETVNVKWVGVPTSMTTTDYVVTTQPSGSGEQTNTGYNSVTYTATRGVARTAVT
jgi:hypothetical protein